ncbi:siderophore-interacting protein [Massilia sp. CCM 8734]|uniref:siderophore-interacting protein n=1 Tax=Massilia sp. CCM 8734 TaxID=2609283 RepID=UPI00141F9772|nr:siderophore-interacting protein [Massilia sp. CCM 8734]NHZ99499.1 siderophore-interacting protein [Massilia sp. CCM 8734]
MSGAPVPEQATGQVSGQVSAKPARPRLRAVVTAREQLSSARIRLTFGGDDAAMFIRAEAAQAPGAWIKLFVPRPAGDSVGRAYTLRRFDLGKGSFDVDFVIHEAGPASSWAEAARPGDRVAFAGPRDGGFTLMPDAQWLVLAGDETALPAIQAILAHVPADLPGIVLIEADRPGEHEAFFAGPLMRLHWVARGPGDDALAKALDGLARPPGAGQAWVAGEAGGVVTVRALLHEKWALDGNHVRAKGYWKRGAADFRS